MSGAVQCWQAIPNRCKKKIGEGDIMATLIIRNLDDDLKSRLRIRATRHDHSMEEEARSILRTVLLDSENREESTGIGTRIRNRLKDIGEVELDLPRRTEIPRAPEHLQ